jgi:hypothetical protein
MVLVFIVLFSDWPQLFVYEARPTEYSVHGSRSLNQAQVFLENIRILRLEQAFQQGKGYCMDQAKAITLSCPSRRAPVTLHRVMEIWILT